MKKLIETLSTIFFLLGFTISCFSQSCNNLPSSFSSYEKAVDAIKNATFQVTDYMNINSWIQEAYYYSCNGEKGFLVIWINDNPYLFKDVELRLWNSFKSASSKGVFYNRNIRENWDYIYTVKKSQNNFQSEIIDEEPSLNAEQKHYAINDSLYLDEKNLNAEDKYIIGIAFLNKENEHYNPRTGFSLIKGAAEDGWTPAFINVAALYGTGFGTLKDEKKSFFWYKKAAEKNLTDSFIMLGSCYREGRGTLIDKNKAFYWYKKAAESGDALAQRYIGIMYSSGDGTSQNEYAAFSWLKKSAENNDAFAQYTIGMFYFFGLGTEENKRMAAKWTRIAYENGENAAKDFWEENELWKY